MVTSKKVMREGNQVNQERKEAPKDIAGTSKSSRILRSRFSILDVDNMEEFMDKGREPAFDVP